MKHTDLQAALAAIAEQAAPAAKIDLWTKLRPHLETSEFRHYPGDASMKTNFSQKRIVGRLALTGLSIAFLLLCLFATPQGRALAQTVLRFFTRAQSDSLPVQPQADYQEPARDKSISEAEHLAGFTIQTLPQLPSAMNFYGASYDTSLKAVVQQFGYQADDIRLSLRQQPFTTQEACTLCGLIGASAPVESVHLGDIDAEYLEGVWELTDNGPVWQNNAYLKTIRWQNNGMAFELIYMGTELDKAALITLAASIK